MITPTPTPGSAARTVAPSAERARWKRVGLRTLRSQFTLIIGLLAFLPNLIMVLTTPLTLNWLVLVWMLMVALLSALIGYVLSGALLRPLHRLETEVSQGDFAQFHKDDPREIRALRGAFGGLMNRLGTEQTRRNAFLATLVHDLKTPLIATGHLTQALTELPLPEAERRDIGQQIQAENARLLALVQQMADAHRFERDDIQLDRVPTDLRAVLGNVARRLTPQAEARGLRLEVAGEGHAVVDAAALERAVGNLAENALRYAQTSVRLLADGHRLLVQDDGPGLSAPLEDLAQPFNAQPATIAGQQYTAGTAGLGLFIARRVAQAHGGDLLYHRSPGGCGPPGAAPASRPLTDSPAHTTFILELPEATP